MTRRNITPADNIARRHEVQRASDESLPIVGVEVLIAEQKDLEHIVRKVFTLCAEVVKSIQLPKKIDMQCAPDIYKFYNQYTVHNKAVNAKRYGQVDYSPDEPRPRREDDIAVAPLSGNTLYSSIKEAVTKCPENLTPGGLQAFDYIISTSNFSRFPVGSYAFPGALILNSAGLWCVFVVDIGVRHGINTQKIIEPRLEPLVSHILHQTHMVYVKK